MTKNTALILGVIFALAPTVLSSGYTYSVSRFQDITVSNTNGILQCDQIECPEETERCHVVKENSKENTSKLKRENTCYDSNDIILKQKLWTEENSENKIVHLCIDVYSNGSSSVSNTQQSYEQSEDASETTEVDTSDTTTSFFRRFVSFFTNLF